MRRILVTGGAGFIGSALCRHIIDNTGDELCVVDKLTYAGHMESLDSVAASPRFRFERADICDRAGVREIVAEFRPDSIIHLAAESHVDRSIDDAGDFIKTNVEGTFSLLDAARKYFSTLSGAEARGFRFLHVSTDEVYGDLADTSDYFRETTPYAPSSPYSASKAASDHLARAWWRTHGLPTVITNCSNNYGPRQFPEKLIPLMVLNALEGKPLPIYGNGMQIRDWLYVEDHARALYLVSEKGTPGETYNIGGNNEMANRDVVDAICGILDARMPRKDGASYREQRAFVTDRPGHDARYAIDAGKIEKELGWRPEETFLSGLEKTVAWYLENRGEWCAAVQRNVYDRERLGLGGGK